MDEKRKPIDIEILQLPAMTTGQYGLPINFFDLLCAIKYDDGTREFMESPHIEFSYPDVPGTSEDKEFIVKFSIDKLLS